ncbi:MAG: endopeptidase La [Clostridium perfringens]|nr:endopeptidase La [Clostridium perfringens]
MKEDKVSLPFIPLRGMTIFPNMVVYFDVGREKSKKAVEQAMINDQIIFLSTQKDPEVEEPKREDVSTIGVVCKIKQILKLPKDTIRVLIEGMDRAEITDFSDNGEFLEVSTETISIDYDKENVEIESLLRLVKDEFFEFLEITSNNGEELFYNLDEMDDAVKVCDIIAPYIISKESEKQKIFEILDIEEKLEKLLIYIKKEIEVTKVEKKISGKVKKKMDKNQKEYYLREQLKVIQEELGEDDENKRAVREYEKKISSKKLSKEVKEKAVYEVSRLKNTQSYSQEGGTIRTYLDTLLDIPWNVYTKDEIDIKKASELLKKEHYGLEDVKERIIEYLAVKKMNNSLKGDILCLVGPPGVGKTSIGKSIAKALDRNFIRMSLGGVRDEADIRGHRRTYVGAIPGRIANGLKQAKSLNPVFLLDEIDKLGSDIKGSPADALLEVLDSEQNQSFRDHYLEVPLDLSQVMFVTTANSLDTIPRPLLDRMEIIEVSGYTYEEKFNIAKKYLIPKKLEEFNVKNKISISDSALKEIIEGYTRESGVRGLERVIASAIRKGIKELIEKDKEKICITTTILTKYLGSKIFTYEKIDQEDKIGVVTGMAWTAYGGDTLPVEVVVMEGKGRLELTGKLGDVMQESARAAYSYVRANREALGITNEFYKEKDIHIHVPEGAVPKDGPSAGVTMITALVSALSERRVKHNVAMTGEITLTGNVLPIGGLKEKCLAAHRVGIDTVIIPKDNEKDLKKIQKIINNKLRVILAEKIDTVLENALI